MQNYKTIFLILILSISTPVFSQDFLRWSDEFNGSNLDTNYWEYQIGDGCPNLCGWGNDERQSYQKGNISVINGMLNINAKKETIGNSSYSSGRIRTMNKFDFSSGRIDVRARLPIGQAYWPAIWFLPTENYYGTWPLSGEIDLMEGKGQEPKNTYGTIHYGAHSPNNKYTGSSYTLPSGLFTSEFHVFSLNWKKDTIQWLVDNVVFSTKTKKDLPDFWWPYNRNFHCIINLAVGGYFLGYPNGTTPDTASLQVDYIRVYQNLNDVYITSPDAILRADQQKDFYTQKIAGATYLWQVPANCKITQGQGTAAIKANWGLKSDSIKVTITYQSNTKTISKFIRTLPDTCEGIFDNVESLRNVFWVGGNGTYKAAVNNPSKDSVNSTLICNRYYRSGSTTYDALVVFSDVIRNAKAFEDGTLLMKMKLYTTAPIGTDVNINFENRALSGLNYPSGRRCVLQAKTSKTRAWEELTFKLILKPDGNTPEGSINQLVILFAPNSNYSDVFYFDEFSLVETPCKTATSSINESEILNNKINIYPNPFTNQISIDAAFVSSQITLFDLTGKELISAKNIDEVNKQIPSLNTGSYIVRITNNERHFYFKIVKTNP
jgi:beta-glucanase (GH16 family)